jgi:hypothetical protein
VNGAQGWFQGPLPPSTVSYTTLMWELDHLLPNIRPTNPYSCDKGRVGGLYLVAYSNFKGSSNVFTLLNEAEGTLSPSSLYLRCSLIVKITQNWSRMFNSLQLLLLWIGVRTDVARDGSKGLRITSVCTYIKGFAYPVRNRFVCQFTALNASEFLWCWWEQLTAQSRVLLEEFIVSGWDSKSPRLEPEVLLMCSKETSLDLILSQLNPVYCIRSCTIISILI